MKKIFYLSAVTLFLTFLMIILGGIVKNTGSSLACPDWPTCNGSFVPPMQGGVAIEHSHRLLGMLIGLLTITLVILTLPFRKIDPRLHKATILALVLVIIQGLMGGLTVLQKISPAISSLHLGVSHLFFAVILFIYYKSCAYCEPAGGGIPHKVPPKLINFSIIAVVVVFIQICLGGIVRHFGAGPACGLGWPAAGLCQELATGQLTIWPQNGPGQLNMLHRLNGIFVMFALIGLTIPVLKFARLNGLKSLRRLLIGIHLTVTIQIILGLHVVAMFIDPMIITLHLAFGLVLWALVMSLLIKFKTRGSPSGSLERIIEGPV